MILTMAEMYVQGVSTRKVTGIVEELFGLEFTSTQVSRAAAERNEQLDAWRNRPIGEITYLILDAGTKRTVTTGRSSTRPQKLERLSRAALREEV
jgi:putative transposase